MPRMQPSKPRPADQTEPDAIVRFARVVEVDLAGGRIVLDAGDVRTAPVRWASGRSGMTRSWSPPSVGEQMVLLCPGGDLAQAVAIGGVAQDAFPPAGNSLRELLEFQDGAVIAYDPETHALEAALPGGATVTITATGGVTIDASGGGLSITGDVTVDGAISCTGDVVSDSGGKAVSLTDHVHGGVQAGSADSGAPK